MTLKVILITIMSADNFTEAILYCWAVRLFKLLNIYF